MDYINISNCIELRSGIYILQRNDHIGTQIFKIGRTGKGIYTRLKSGYQRGTVIYYYCPIKDTVDMETKILNTLRNESNIINRKDIGLEYFESDYNNIFNIVNNSIQELKIEHIYNINELIQFCNQKNTIKNIQTNNIIKIKSKKIVNELFKCERCGHETNQKASLIKHLNKINACEPKLSTITTKELLLKFKPIPTVNIELFENKTDSKLNCKYCNKFYNYEYSKTRHEIYCDKKNYIEETNQYKEIIKNLQLELKKYKEENDILKDKLNKLQMIINE